MAQAEARKADFERIVVEPLSQFGSTTCGLKSSERAVDKALFEYGGDFGRITDLLRGCVICPSDQRKMELILGCCDFLLRLELEGEITIVEIQNHYRDGATASGYVNVSIDFHGHVCEFQILDQAIYELNSTQTPTYELCRSCNLVCPLLTVSRRGSAVGHAMKHVPLALRLSVGFLGFLVGLMGAVMATLYLVHLFYPGLDFLLPDEPFVFKLFFGWHSPRRSASHPAWHAVICSEDHVAVCKPCLVLSWWVVAGWLCPWVPQLELSALS
jgi:hypothetical protein